MANHFLTTTSTALFLLLTFITILSPSLACPTCPKTPPPKPKTPVPCPPPPHKPKSPTSPPAPQQAGQCPIDILKLDGCVDVLGGLLHAVLGGSNAKEECCPVLAGLADADAGICLCTAIKANLLNINLLLPVALDVLVDCGKRLPADYTCPSSN